MKLLTEKEVDNIYYDLKGLFKNKVYIAKLINNGLRVTIHLTKDGKTDIDVELKQDRKITSTLVTRTYEKVNIAGFGGRMEKSQERTILSNYKNELHKQVVESIQELLK